MGIVSACRCWLIVLAAVAVAGCATTRTTSGGAVGVDREQTMLVSSAEVDRSAAKAYRTMMDEAQSKNLLNRNAQQTARVRAIARRLIPATAAFRGDAPGWKWEVNVVSSKELNAWCMPGGKIAVYTGLIEQLPATDDELAAVMGHEIAHALREHGREKAGQAAGLNIAAALGGALIGAYFGVDAGLGQSMIGSVGDLAFMRPNSREMEQEADRIGVELAARAGYDPAAAITLWEKMGRVSGGQPPQWLSTHPSHQSRIADLRVYAQRVQPLYLAARKSP
ncbi:M48 family metallopeptidase [Accumulibacter sp.]|uniref:M48 family metallopeptidase n=1 Tax=Accumulibacter sp. TaxID=2053492 RepID=UPI0025D63847|nr:M48 family metallopeptidase [Accumulibacter sp.]MCP5227181.1 M48 family metallopeptidase [Accumulibacter sp.]